MTKLELYGQNKTWKKKRKDMSQTQEESVSYEKKTHFLETEICEHVSPGKGISITVKCD